MCAIPQLVSAPLNIKLNIKLSVYAVDFQMYDPRSFYLLSY